MKKVVAMLLLLAFVLPLLLCIPQSVSAESLYIRKIVSVVYDDSGSMLDANKVDYASYAMQAFCSMLNSEDQMYLTYIANPYVTYDIDLSAGGIQKTVDSVRDHRAKGGTYFEAVKQAYKKLTSINDPNPNTQYWLVVITDGAFEEFIVNGDISEYQRLPADQKVEYEEARKQELNKEFLELAKAPMPNGTKLQTTFMAINTPFGIDENLGENIYFYKASDTDAIINTMSDMADRVSGRTRLTEKDIKKVDDKTIEISSAIPLLNIVALAQGCNAKVVKATDQNGNNIPIARQVSLSYPGNDALVGGSYLLGDSQSVIGAGSYTVTFDQPVDLNQVVILFEPALEMRTSITLNGEEIEDIRVLEHTIEGEKLSFSCKIYEMGTSKEIDPALLPPGTKYELTVTENGTVTKRIQDSNLELVDYELKNVDTELYAAVTIAGFNPIAFSKQFTPAEYIPPETTTVPTEPPVVYTMEAAFAGAAQSVRFDDIGNNTELVISFRVYANGEPVTDAEAVKALNPSVSASPQGNSGEISYSDDGKILYTPKAASMGAGAGFTVDVTCAIDGGVSATKSYNVLMANYQVIGTDATQAIKKTEFYGNQIGVTFRVTKDGAALSRDEIQGGMTIQFNQEHQDLVPLVDVTEDGLVSVIPQAAENRELNFGTWWFNWVWYFGISKENVEVTFSHPFGTAQADIPVVEADTAYLCLNVIAPMLLELVILLVLANYLFCVLTKPKFGKTAILYVGDIRYNVANGTHMIRNFRAVHLAQFNKIEKGNGRLQFKRKAAVVSANGIDIRAERHGDVSCEELFPWYKSRVTPVEDVKITKPDDLVKLTQNKSFEIEEFAVTETVNENYQRNLPSATSRVAKYFVAPDPGAVVTIEDKKVIRSGKIFIYKIS